MNSSLQKIITVTAFMGGFLIFGIRDVKAEGCCVYTAKLSDPGCYASNAAGEKQKFVDGADSKGNTIFATDFSCLAFIKTPDSENICPYGYLNLQDGTECIAQGFTVKQNPSEKIVAAYQKLALPNDEPALKICLDIPGASKKETSSYDAQCTAGIATLKNHSEASEAFGVALIQAVQAWHKTHEGPVEELAKLLIKEQNNYCCVPKSSTFGTQCAPPANLESLSAAEVEQGVKDAKEGKTLGKYYACTNQGDSLFEHPCSDTKFQIQDPNPGQYHYEGTYLNMQKLCSSLTKELVCECNKQGECKPYATQTQNKNADLKACEDELKKGSKPGFCEIQEKGKDPLYYCVQHQAEVEYQGSDFVIPDASSFNQIGTVDAKQLIARFIKGLLGVIGSLSLVMFIYGGILLMTDRGSADQAGKARDILVWTSLGLAVIFAAYAIVDFIFQAFPK